MIHEVAAFLAFPPAIICLEQPSHPPGEESQASVLCDWGVERNPLMQNM